MALGQQGADTITHIVSILALVAMVIAPAAIIGYYQHGFSETALLYLTAYWITCAIGASYYSVKYQQSPTGVVIQTDATTTK